MHAYLHKIYWERKGDDYFYFGISSENLVWNLIMYLRYRPYISLYSMIRILRNSVYIYWKSVVRYCTVIPHYEIEKRKGSQYSNLLVSNYVRTYYDTLILYWRTTVTFTVYYTLLRWFKILSCQKIVRKDTYQIILTYLCTYVTQNMHKKYDVSFSNQNLR